MTINFQQAVTSLIAFLASIIKSAHIMPRAPKNCTPLPSFKTSSFEDTDREFLKLSRTAPRYEGPFSEKCLDKCLDPVSTGPPVKEGFDAPDEPQSSQKPTVVSTTETIPRFKIPGLCLLDSSIDDVNGHMLIVCLLIFFVYIW